MELYSEHESYQLYKGNMLDVLDELQSNFIDSIITDPPYELNFMGRDWDSCGISFQSDTWKKCLRVLKPGGYLLTFGGSRTFHRIACSIEDAGFEIRDTIMWLYGSGFPKGLNIAKGIESKLETGSPSTRGQRKLSMGQNYQPTGQANHFNGLMFKDADDEYVYNNNYIELTHDESKAWKGWNTSLKPAYEPIIIARKPFDGSLVDNIMDYGVGGLNIDECRIATEDYIYNHGNTNGTLDSVSVGDFNAIQPHENMSTLLGRFPANTILTYDDTNYDEVCGGFPYTKSTGGSGVTSKKSTFKNTYNGGWGKEKDCAHLGGLGDEGSASRYFYCAKASKKDRDEGLEDFKTKTKIFNGTQSSSSVDMKDVEQRFTTECKNIHPTVKPTSLMQYLIRLVTPNGGTVLDPFNGSGSTGKAVMYENKERNKDYKYIGIELDENYLEISKARIEYARTNEICDDVSHKILYNSNIKITKKQRKLF